MKVFLLIRKLAGMHGRGWERYSTSILEQFRKLGLEVENSSVELSVVKPNPYGSSISVIAYDLLGTPFLLAKHITKYVIHATYPEQGMLFPLFWRIGTKVVTIHDTYWITKLPSNRVSTLVRIHALIACRASVLGADHVIANSMQTKEELITHLGIPSEKVTVVPLGVNDNFKPLPSARQGKVLFGYIGTLNERKRIHLAVAAYNRFLENHPLSQETSGLVVYGDGPTRPALEKLAASRAPNRVEFRDFIPEDKLVHAYNELTALVYPSAYEGFGLQILEAQRCGIPVLLMEDAQIPNEIKREAVICRNIDDMADQMHNLAENAEYRQNVSQKGLEYSKQFTWESCAYKTLQVYARVALGNC